MNNMQKGDGSQLERELQSLRRAGQGREVVVPNPKAKLLDQVREVMRLRHYAIRTEQSYCDWIRRYVQFHKMRSREELSPGTGTVEQFLSDLAVNGRVAASTQNQVAATGHGHSNHPGIAGPQRCRHDHDLHPRSAAGWARGSQPAG